MKKIVTTLLTIAALTASANAAGKASYVKYSSIAKKAIAKARLGLENRHEADDVRMLDELIKQFDKHVKQDNLAAANAMGSKITFAAGRVAKLAKESKKREKRRKDKLARLLREAPVDPEKRTKDRSYWEDAKKRYSSLVKRSKAKR